VRRMLAVTAAELPRGNLSIAAGASAVGDAFEQLLMSLFVRRCTSMVSLNGAWKLSPQFPWPRPGGTRKLRGPGSGSGLPRGVPGYSMLPRRMAVS
jgi:hypothetical protein